MNAHSRDFLEPMASIEAEQALLGAILNGPEVLERIDGVVTAEDFSELLHRDLFSRFLEMHGSGQRIDITLARVALGELAQASIVEGLNVSEYIARLYAAAVTMDGAPHYARTIRDLADKRRIAATADDLRLALSGTESPPAVAALGIEMLDGIVSARADSNTPRVSMGQAAEEAVRRMSDAMARNGAIGGMTWGLHELDARTNGLHRGELVVVAARPSMGKTGLGISCARQTAAAGNEVLFFSLEMKADALASRALADLCYGSGDPIHYFDLDRGALSDAAATRVVDAQYALGGLPLEIEQQPALTVSQIGARARKHQQRLQRKGRRLGVLFVDHLHLVRASERYRGNTVAELTEISGGLKALAKDLDVAVVALAQLSRQVEGRDDKRPHLSDLRGSGSIEQDADTIIFLYREAYYLERQTCDSPADEDKRQARLFEVRNRLEAIIAKQRNGPIGTVGLFFDAACNAARDLARAGR